LYVRVYIQKFLDWPPEAKTANGTASLDTPSCVKYGRNRCFKVLRKIYEQKKYDL